MKNLFFLFTLLVILPMSTQAQDDMYFVPTKKNLQKERAERYSYDDRDTYYSGSSRSVDEYNRRGSSYQYVPSDTTMMGSDFELTKKMSRWDGYTPSEAYWEGYDRGRSDEWHVSSWHSPWYYSSFYPWYDSYWYYDGWYRPSWTWHIGWHYDPWYYRHYSWGWGWGGYYSYHRPYHYGGGYYGSGRSSYYRPSTGTQSHGRIINSGRRYSGNGIGAGRSTSVGRSSTMRSSSGSVGAGRSSSGSYGTSRSSSGSFGTSRSTGGSIGSFGSSRSSSGSIGAGRSSGGSVGGGSFGGGSRGGGGSRSAGRR
jgi:hypothetical protein